MVLPMSAVEYSRKLNNSKFQYPIQDLLSVYKRLTEAGRQLSGRFMTARVARMN
jgi:hypothetical protein